MLSLTRRHKFAEFCEILAYFKVFWNVVTQDQVVLTGFRNNMVGDEESKCKYVQYTRILRPFREL